MQSIFSYTSYRRLIRDFYEDKKKEEPSFSYQVFAKKAGLNAKSYIIEIVSGKKPLSKNRIFNLSRAMGMKKRETEFFEALVNFNEAKTIKDREIFFERLKSISGKSSSKILNSDKYEYFSKWYHPVVRELVTMKDFTGDLKSIAKRIKPPITAKQIQTSVKLLLELGLIEKRSSNRYRQTDVSLTTGDDVTSLAILKFQEESFSLAQTALDKVPGEFRDIATFTAGISEGCFQTIKKELKHFRKHLAQIVEQDEDPDRVYQLAMGFFPVSDLPKGENKK